MLLTVLLRTLEHALMEFLLYVLRLGGLLAGGTLSRIDFVTLGIKRLLGGDVPVGLALRLLDDFALGTPGVSRFGLVRLEVVLQLLYGPRLLGDVLRGVPPYLLGRERDGRHQLPHLVVLRHPSLPVRGHDPKVDRVLGKY